MTFPRSPKFLGSVRFALSAWRDMFSRPVPASIGTERRSGTGMEDGAGGMACLAKSRRPGGRPFSGHPAKGFP